VLIPAKVDKKYADSVSSRLKSIQGDCSINILQQGRWLYACWPLEGADRERKPKNIIIKVLVTPVIPAVVLSRNPDAPSLLFAPFDKGGNGGFLIVE
jgi:hypothetical protein